jgi:hypothetical protein
MQRDSTHVISLLRHLSDLPPSMACDAALPGLIAAALVTKVFWPVITHPTAYPSLWGRLEGWLLLAREGNPIPGTPLISTLLDLVRTARSAADTDEIFAALPEVAARHGLTSKALARGLGLVLVAVIWKEPELLDQALPGS